MIFSEYVRDRKVRSFSLSPKFIENYRGKQPKWGPIGYITYKRTYSRPLEEGGTEEFWQTCQRVVEGCFNIQKIHCRQLNLPWDETKAQKSAQDMYQRMWSFKFLPPGRGLWMMGTPYIYKQGSAALTNCSFISTNMITEDFAEPFCFLMDMSMLGVGVGSDTRGAGQIKVCMPKTTEEPFVVEDSREGWVSLLRVILNSFVGKSSYPLKIDYSQVRGAGVPIKGFGGTASGPKPLHHLMQRIVNTLMPKGVEVSFHLKELDPEMHTLGIVTTTINGSGSPFSITSTQIVDILNFIGCCVVAGNVRRSAEVVFGDPNDEEFMALKQDKEALASHRWASNNSIFAEVGMDYSKVVDAIAVNGEPGLIWLDNARKYSRMNGFIDNKDTRAQGFNPCFTGDTLIAVADGRNAVPIKQLAEEDFDVPVYSMNKETGKVEIKMGRHPRITRTQSDLVEIVFDDDSKMRVTPDHKMVLLDGTEVEAQHLEPGSSLPRFTKRQEYVSKKNRKKYWRTYCDTRDSRESKIMEHRLIAQFHDLDKWRSLYKTGKSSGWQSGGIVVHHKDFDTLNNSPDNLEIMTFRDHQKLHAQLADMSGEKNPMWGKKHSDETKEKIGRKTAERRQDPKFIKKLPASFTPATRKKMSEKMIEQKREMVLAYYKEQEAKTDLKTCWVDGCLHAVKICENCSSEFVVPWRERERSYCSSECVIKTLAQSETRKEKAREYFVDKQRQTLHDQMMVYKDLQDSLGHDPCKKEWESECQDRKIPVRFQKASFNPHVLSGYKELKEVACDYNHRVKSVRKLEEKEDVYNITVDDFHTVGIVLNQDSSTISGIYSIQCGEQILESGEACNLVETFPAHHDSYEDYEATLKMAYLYAKTVTLVPTHNMKANAVMMRNRRIGCSMSGIIQAMAKFGRREFLNTYCDQGYQYIKKLDNTYSEWLCVPRSIKMTTVKPSGCQIKETLVNTSEGIFQLGEMGNLEGEAWQDVDYTTTFGESVTKFYVNGEVPTKVFYTQDGNRLESSYNHKYRVFDGSEIVWKSAEDLVVGDNLVVSLGDYTKIDESTLISVDSPYHNTKAILQPLNMSPKLAWLLGLIYGDGSVHEKGIRISFNRKESSLVFFVSNLVKELFGIDVRVDNEHSIYIHSTHLLEYLKANKMLKEYSHELKIPLVIRKSSKESIKAFITGLWRADGVIFNRSTWGICIVSEQFSLDLLALCRAVGFNVKITNAGPGGWGSRDRWIITSRFFDAENLRYISNELKGRILSDNLWLDSIRHIEDSCNFTYDISVPNTKEYVANGVISHNTVSLLASATPGIHSPHSKFYIRRVRMSAKSPLVDLCKNAGLNVVQDVYSDDTMVVEFPIKEPYFVKGKSEISVWEQFANMVDLQKHWSDNAVSCTISFKSEERQELKSCLETFEDQLKGVSLLPLVDHGYALAPYETIDEATYNRLTENLKPLVLDEVGHEVDEKFCNNDSCELSFNK